MRLTSTLFYCFILSFSLILLYFYSLLIQKLILWIFFQVYLHVNPSDYMEKKIIVKIMVPIGFDIALGLFGNWKQPKLLLENNWVSSCSKTHKFSSNYKREFYANLMVLRSDYVLLIFFYKLQKIFNFGGIRMHLKMSWYIALNFKYIAQCLETSHFGFVYINIQRSDISCSNWYIK